MEETCRKVGQAQRYKRHFLAPQIVWWGEKDIHREFRSRYNVKSVKMLLVWLTE